MIGIAKLPVEEIGVYLLTHELEDQVSVIIPGARAFIRALHNGVNRFFLVIGVKVADDQEATSPLPVGSEELSKYFGIV